MGKVEVSGIWHSSHCVSDCTEMDGNDGKRDGQNQYGASCQHLIAQGDDWQRACSVLDCVTGPS